ncbi:MAG TPA: hypothetical protein VGF56_10040 [Rhizomicrobium sp.]|jgi:hypothetical protein
MGKRIAAGLAGGVFAGTLDIFVAMALSGASAEAVFRFLAAGVVGRDAAMDSGWHMPALGFALQEFISIVAALVYVFASTRLPILLKRPIPCGIAYGAVVNVVLTFVVQPLSLVARIHPLNVTPWLENLGANMSLFGPPIALIAAWMLRPRA